MKNTSTIGSGMQTLEQRALVLKQIKAMNPNLQTSCFQVWERQQEKHTRSNWGVVCVAILLLAALMATTLTGQLLLVVD